MVPSARTSHVIAASGTAGGRPVLVGTLLLAITALSPLAVIEARSADTEFAGRVLMEAESGAIFFESDLHRQWPPASMVKMMVMLLASEALADGRLALDEPVRASRWASRMGGSQVYLREGEVFPLRELLKAIIIASANDAAVAVAEHLAETTSAFVALMNQRGRQLGLNDTVYHSVHGLPPGPGEEDDLSSAHDLARLAREILQHDDLIGWASVVEAPFRNGAFRLTNTNRLIGSYRGANGLKTGYHRRAGYGMTATATREKLTLIAVVLGASRKQVCMDEAARPLTHGFSTYKVIEAARKGRPIGPTIPVEGGDVPEVLAVADEDLRLVLKRAQAKASWVEARVPRLLTAPVRKGEPIGEVAVMGKDATLGRVALVADRDVTAVGWLAWWRNWWAARGQPEP